MILNSIFQMLDRDKNNTDIMTNVLNDLKTTSYDFLYEVEKNLCGVVRLEYTYDSPYIEHENSFEFVGRVEFVDHSYCEGFKFAKENGYGKLLTLEYIIDNPDKFPRIPLVFINGDLYTNIWVQPNEDTTNFYLNGITREEFKVIHNKGFQMSILLIPIQNISTGININLRHISMSDIYSHDATDNHFITYEEDTVTRSDYYTKIGRNIPSNDFLFFINNPSDTRSYKTKLFKMIDFEYNNDIDSTITFNINQLDNYNLVNNNTTKLIHINNYFKKIKLSSSENYFELPILDLPIPTENMIIFERVDTNRWKYRNNLNISKIYPVTYKVEDNHNELLIYILYNDGKDLIKYKHLNELSLYYRFVVNIFEKYKNKTTPSEILNYNPRDIFFDISDFYNKIKLYTNVDEVSLTPTYKINELNRITETNGDGYMKYLKQLTGENSVYYIRTKTISDLATRIRLDNTQEISNISEHITFSEPHYLFRLAYINDYEKIDIFVDMKHVVPVLYNDKVYIYMYIPVKYITSDSVIKVERLKITNLNKLLYNTDDGYIKLDVPVNKNICVNDIYFSYFDENEGMPIYIYIPKEEYRFYTKYNDSEYVDITENSFYMYSPLYVKFTNQYYHDVGIRMHINKDLFIDSFENITYGTYVEYNTNQNDNTFDISLPKDRIIYSNEIYLSFEADDREIFIDKSMYTVYTKSESSDDFIIVPHTQQTVMNEYIRIVFNDNGVHNPFDIKLNIIKTDFSDDNIKLLIDDENNTLYFDINRQYNNDLSHFLIFVDGLLLSHDKYDIVFNENYNGPHRIYIHNESFQYIKGHKLSLVYSPNKFYKVYSDDILSETRYINTSGSIGKPLNLKWHDIYVDGYQLSPENIEIFSPYKFFTHKIIAKSNITILQKNLDPPPHSMLSETTNDIILSYVLSRLDELLLYIMSLHKLLNPDLQQFTEEMIRRYTFLFDEFDNIFVNPDNDMKISSVLGVYELSDIDEDHSISISSSI